MKNETDLLIEKLANLLDIPNKKLKRILKDTFNVKDTVDNIYYELLVIKKTIDKFEIKK